LTVTPMRSATVHNGARAFGSLQKDANICRLPRVIPGAKTSAARGLHARVNVTRQRPRKGWHPSRWCARVRAQTRGQSSGPAHRRTPALALRPAPWAVGAICGESGGGRADGMAGAGVGAHMYVGFSFPAGAKLPSMSPLFLVCPRPSSHEPVAFLPPF